jgi:DNA-binding LytR/AlgR family response regulator
MHAPTALIAEDEPLLAAALQAELARAWPQLQVVATVGDGRSAVDKALALQPDVLFFDVQMPGQSGLDAALALADAWPDPAPGTAGGGKPFPALVFVTAFDRYAVAAFDAQAVDYVLKPVQAARLQKTVQKVQLALASRAQTAMDFEATLAQLRGLLAAGQPAPAGLAPLQMLQASVGNSIRMVPVDELLCLEAADKYVRVLNLTGHEFLIRTPLKDLLPQLDARQFWQIHRGCVVRASHIEFVTRDEAGKLWLQLRGYRNKLAVSRLYAHLFRAM